MKIEHRKTCRPGPAWFLCVLLGSAFATATVGCGDDGGGSSASARNRAKKRPSPSKPGGQRGGTESSGGLAFYDKIEKYAGDEEEKKSLRKPFEPLEDFIPSNDGLGNRDPFRSYVIRPVIDDDNVKRPSDECKKNGHVAPSFPLRELQLVGIILRGTRSYALFRDSATYGYVVRKGDCLGQEKAKVMSIRAGFVSLQVTPEAANDEVVPVPQDRVIPLYPDEYIPDTEP